MTRRISATVGARRAPPQVDELPAIKDGLDYLEPGQAYRYPVGIVFPEEFERAAEKPWVFQIEYENQHGQKRTGTNIIDFSQFRGMFSEPNHLEQIADHLSFIQQDLHLLAQGYTSLRVITETQEDLERRREETRRAQEDRASSISDAPEADDNEG